MTEEAPCFILAERRHSPVRIYDVVHHVQAPPRLFVLPSFKFSACISPVREDAKHCLKMTHKKNHD